MALTWAASIRHASLWLIPATLPLPACPATLPLPACPCHPAPACLLLPAAPGTQVLKHEWVVSRGGILPRPLGQDVVFGAATVASIRRLRNLCGSVVAFNRAAAAAGGPGGKGGGKAGAAAAAAAAGERSAPTGVADSAKNSYLRRLRQSQRWVLPGSVVVRLPCPRSCKGQEPAAACVLVCAPANPAFPAAPSCRLELSTRGSGAMNRLAQNLAGNAYAKAHDAGGSIHPNGMHAAAGSSHSRCCMLLQS